MLVIEGLRRTLADFSIDVPRLKVEEGETFALLGPTGAGKSRLLEVLAGFAAAERGTIALDGQDVSRLPPEKRRISILFQEPHLFPHLTVSRNITYGCSDPRRFDEIVGLLGLRPLLQRHARVVSGGERQLVAVARALMVRPRALLLDEAFSAIDPQSRKRVLDAFRQVQEKLKITTLAVTHNFEEALTLAQRLGIMLNGKLVQTGPPQDVFAHPASPAVAIFLGAENLFAGRLKRLPEAQAAPGGRFAALFESGPLKLHVVSEKEGLGYVLVHPYDITVSRRPPQESSALNQLRGRVREISTSGGLAQLRIDAGAEFQVNVTPQSRRELQLEKGTEVYLAFKAAAARVY